MVTILLERREFIRATHFTSADLFLGDGGRIEIVSELARRQFTSVDSSIVKGPIRTHRFIGIVSRPIRQKTRIWFFYMSFDKQMYHALLPPQ